MSAKSTNSNTVTTIAEEVLNTFERVEENAHTGLRSASFLTPDSIGIMESSARVRRTEDARKDQ